MNKPPPVLLLLLAHGSRQPEWARPFEAVRDQVQQAHPELTVRLAFLEFMQPSLRQTLLDAGEHGYSQVQIAPLFLGSGGHLQRDIPQMAQAVQAHYPDLNIDVAAAAGEQAEVIEALARFAARVVTRTAD
ncbi:sirohydrochlorin chelatase [Thiomonas intermedia]|uniref:sirohydrochlorin chelatase n=1 Tax=Thiomonas intermedia TaxID=926 RepID=UPI0009A54E5C|nr:CbiX/SirB N-terminal domain-containing protein [Thiomonas intermedia]